MTSNHQLTTREIPSSSNLSSPPDYWRKYVQSNMQVADSWNHFDSTGTPFPLNVLSNLERLRPKRWFVILSMKNVNGWDTISELNNVHDHSPLLHCRWIFPIFTGELYQLCFLWSQMWFLFHASLWTWQGLAECRSLLQSPSHCKHQEKGICLARLAPDPAGRSRLPEVVWRHNSLHSSISGFWC